MGRHRVESSEPPWYRVPPAETPRRRRRRWPAAAFVAVLLVVGGWFGWSWMHGTPLEQSASGTSHSCPAGSESLQIAATPAIAEVLGRIASDYMRANPVVLQHCVTIAVSSVDAKSVLTGLAQGWNEGTLGPKPDAWIADSMLWTNQLPAGSIGDPPQSLATSPIVLAMPADAAKAAVTVAPAFAALPGLVAQDNGWATFHEPAWGRFTVALPDPSANAASLLALEAMLDPATQQGQPPVNDTLLNSAAVQHDLTALAGSQPSPPATSSHEALVSLGGADGIVHAPFSAVPVAEVDLYERNLGIDGDVKPPNVLDEVQLPAGTPYLDYPFAPLAGSWVTSDLVAAAENFRDFLLSGPEQAQLSRNGFRVSDSYARPDPSPGMQWGTTAQAPALVDAASVQHLVAAWQAAAGN